MADETVNQADQQVTTKLEAGPPDDKGTVGEQDKKGDSVTGGDKVDDTAPAKAEAEPEKAAELELDKPADSEAADKPAEPEIDKPAESEAVETANTEPAPAAATATAAPGVEEDGDGDVKMETSLTEEKPAEEKVSEDTSVTQSNTITSKTPATQATPVANETKEVVSDTKPVATNEKTTSPAENTKNMGTRQYLDATVVPILHTALSHLAKQRPENPVGFLGQFLLDNQDKFTNSK